MTVYLHMFDKKFLKSQKLRIKVICRISRSKSTTLLEFLRSEVMMILKHMELSHEGGVMVRRMATGEAVARC